MILLYRIFTWSTLSHKSSDNRKIYHRKNRKDRQPSSHHQPSHIFLFPNYYVWSIRLHIFGISSVWCRKMGFRKYEEEKEVKGVKWCYSMKGHEISSWILEHSMSNEVTDKSETDHLETGEQRIFIFYPSYITVL